MKPGRNLDALVAQHVMGLKDIRHRGDEFDWGPEIYPGFGALVPNYSRSIQDAWEIVWKLRPVFDFHIETNFQGWIAWFGHASINKVYGESPEHAICLAALRALEIKV